MIEIPAKQVSIMDDNGGLSVMLMPSSPIPDDAVEIRCDGVNYVIYQSDDLAT
ncbi:hypothetical protein [Achromobacter denitrificans]|uniref:hypothetical protein n=1 Tax=Achromobacter denitrificans TaxID=32002 RepID=UPI00240E5A05|nr:hypothetical protein [Achromobacter denitrificans]